MVQKRLKKYLDLDVITVTGKTLGENLEEIEKDGFFERNIGYLHNYGLERDDVIFHPKHEYTKKLLAAVPRLEGKRFAK